MLPNRCEVFMWVGRRANCQRPLRKPGAFVLPASALTSDCRRKPKLKLKPTAGCTTASDAYLSLNSLDPCRFVWARAFHQCSRRGFLRTTAGLDPNRPEKWTKGEALWLDWANPRAGLFPAKVPA